MTLWSSNCSQMRLKFTWLLVISIDLTDCLMFQDCLDKLMCWATNWQLNVSMQKCARLHVSNNTTNINHCNYSKFQYHLDSVNWPDVNCITDLGINVCSNLKFRIHINKIVSKAHKRASLIDAARDRGA